jgi:diketogulonate reductase-like aldo/keto reductase
LQKIAQRLSKEVGWEVDEATVLLQWTIQWGAVAVTTSSRKENIDKMVKSAELKLSKEDMEEIETVGKSIHYRAYDVS